MNANYACYIWYLILSQLTFLITKKTKDFQLG